jgi:hypothetical protein
VTDRSELVSIERRLSGRKLDFSETFVRVGQLKQLLDVGHAPATDQTVTVLGKLLASDRHLAQTQAFHLFESIAASLAAIGCSRFDTAVSRRALQVLMPAATQSRGEKQRASAQTAGTLPVNIEGPRQPSTAAGNEPPRMSLKKILARIGHTHAGGGKYLGRSLVVPLQENGVVAVVKITRKGECPAGLVREAWWQEYLNSKAPPFAGHFNVPRPVRVGRGYLFRPTGLPGSQGRSSAIDPASAMAIAFAVDRDYFVYPNDHRPQARMPYDRFRRVLLRAAGLFGELAAAGIVHTAPVPLFHNRVQRDRRDDGGLYEWDRAGRLDRWLLSSRYPNFGPTGIRDFEHLTSLGPEEGRRLYRHIGNHLLSLILVAGSHFRHKAPELMGEDEKGALRDLRFLFDREKFIDLVSGVFQAYHSGFSGGGPDSDLTADIETLVDSLIEQMGVDRHMLELLRREDQNRMSTAAFYSLLSRHNLPVKSLAAIEKGRADIEIRSGPHLGPFNGPISVPELPTFLRSATAAIVAGRFMARRFSKGKGGGCG